MRVRRTNQPTSAFALRILILLGVALALLVPAYVQAKRIEFAPHAQAAPAEWSQLGYTPQRTGYVPTTLEAVSRVRWIWNGPINGGDAGPASNHLALPEGVQPVAGGGSLYLGHSDGTVRALAETDGREVWITDLTASQGITNTLAYDAETNSVYAGTMGGRVYRLSASNGVVSGFVDLGGQILMAPLLVANHIYIGSTNGYFYALDKSTLRQVWSYDAGAALHGSPAYSANQGGTIIILAEDRSVHALRQSDGARLWRTVVNGAVNPLTNSVFVSTYPVVSDVNNVVIVRSFFDWNLTWQPSGGAPASISDIRSFLTANPSFQSFFVLDLVTGLPRYVAPVMGGAMGNGGIYYSPPPQAVVRRLDDGSEVAYLLWRNRQSCGGVCDGREDTTLGEMDLTTGAIRFVQDYKNQGSIRVPTDEQGVLAMAGDSMFHAHWMTLGGVRITDRSASLGATYANPIRTLELAPVVNTLASEACPERDSIRRYCPSGMRVPEESYVNDPGYYVYYYNQKVYDLYWRPPVRSVIINNGAIYWRTADGAIVALQTGAYTPAPSPTGTSTFTPTPSSTPGPSNTPTGAPPPSNTPTSAPSPSNTPTSAPPPSNTPTGAPSPSNTPTGAPPPSNTPTGAPPPSNTPTGAPPPSNTSTPTRTATPTLAAAPANYALAFAGANQASGPPIAGLTGSWTVELWARPATDAQNAIIVAIANDASGWSLELNGGRPTLWLAGPGGAWRSVQHPTPLAANTWHHLAATYDTATGVARIFANGAAGPAATIGQVSAGPALNLGGFAPYPFFNGQIDELRLSGGVRYSASFTPPGAALPVDAATRALFSFNEGSGQVTRDRSGNGYTLTLGRSTSVEPSDPTWVTSTAPTSEGAPSPTSAPTPSATRTATPTGAPAPSATRTATPTGAPAPSATPSATRTATPTASPTRTATAISTPTVTPPAVSDRIFADDFETGSFSAWSAVTSDGGDLAVSGAAALNGAFGMAATINDNRAIYVTDTTPAAEPRYRVRFYLDPNSATMTNGDAFFVLIGYSGAATPVFRVELRRSNNAYQIRASLSNDASTWTNSGWYTISDDPHFVEIDWQAATTAGANNGRMTLWIDGQQQASLTTIDNDTLRVEQIRLGAVAGIDNGTRGVFFFDTFESRRQTYIGPVVAR